MYRIVQGILVASITVALCAGCGAASSGVPDNARKVSDSRPEIDRTEVGGTKTDGDWAAFQRAALENQLKIEKAMLEGRQKRPADLLRPEQYRAILAKTPQGQLCLRFADQVNRDKVPAADLLGPAPAAPTAPVSPEEAARLDAEFILRNTYRISEVRPYESPKDGPPRFLFVLKGSVTSERLKVKTSKGDIEEGQRTMGSPDVIVEVRDGKIYGVRAQLHVW
jgi:hypothetical protein